MLGIWEVLGTEILQPQYPLLPECTRGRREEEGEVRRLGDAFRFNVYGAKFLLFF